MQKEVEGAAAPTTELYENVKNDAGNDHKHAQQYQNVKLKQRRASAASTAKADAAALSMAIYQNDPPVSKPAVRPVLVLKTGSGPVTSDSDYSDPSPPKPTPSETLATGYANLNQRTAVEPRKLNLGPSRAADVPAYGSLSGNIFAAGGT